MFGYFFNDIHVYRKNYLCTWLFVYYKCLLVREAFGIVLSQFN